MFEQRKGNERGWARQHFLNIKTMHQVRELEREINSLKRHANLDFDDFGIELKKVKTKVVNCKNINDVLLSCLITSFAANLGLFSGNERIGYTLINLDRTIQMYGTTSLSLQGINPKWIIGFDLYEN